MTASSTSVDHARFASTIEAARREDDLFEEFYVEPVGDDDISMLRRRRRPVANSLESPIRAVTLVEEDGVLYWRDGVPGRAVGPRRRGRRRGTAIAPEGTYVMTREFPALAPNKVIDALDIVERRLLVQLVQLFVDEFCPVYQMLCRVARDDDVLHQQFDYLIRRLQLAAKMVARIA